jgi:PAS domain S-box-containing protein
MFGVVLVFRDISEKKRAEQARRQLALIIESSYDAIVSENMDGIILTWNRGAEEIYGYRAAEIIGQPISTLVPPDRIDELAVIRRRTTNGERIENFETVRRRKDGTLIDIAMTVSPMWDVEGKTVGVSKVARDITARKRAERERAHLAAIVTSSDDAIISKTLNGVITTWNKASEKMFGFTAEEAIGQEIYLIIPPERHGEETEILTKLSRGEQIDHFETVRRHKSGRLLDVSLTISPIKDASGNIIGASKTARDMTDRRRGEIAQARLGAIIESSDDAIVSKTLDSVITSWNKAAEKMFGFTAEEAIGEQIYLIIPLDRHEEETEILAKLRRGERIEHFETVRRRKDGTLIDVSLTVSPIKDSRGNVVGASKIARDITETKKAAALVQEGHETLETINRVGQILFSELDLEKVVQTLTDAATAVTGAAFGSFFYNVVDERGASYMLYTLSGVPREHFAQFPMPRATDLFGPTFRGEGVIRIDDVRKDPRYGKNSPYFGMPKGHLPVTSYLAAPVRSRSGDVLGGLFFGHPEPGMFTERHDRILIGLAGQAGSAMDNARLYDAMRKARSEAETANRLKDEFLATVSHELRTPLNAILGWARLLHMGKLDDESRARAVETIERSAVAQGQLIEDILDVSRIITGKLRLDVSPVETGQLVAEAIESVRPSAEAKGVKLQTVLDTKANLIRGDAHRLQQILWNLLSNAIKFTPKGGRV